MSFELISPQADAALVAGLVAAVGWWANSWRVGKKIEGVKTENLLKIEGLKFINEKDLNFLKTELEGLSAHISDRRKILLTLLDSVTQARDAAWSLVNDSSSLEPTKLLAKTAHSLQAISAFFAATGNASSVVFLEDNERSQLTSIGERLSELFLNLDLDAGRKPDYERVLLGSAKRMDQEVDKFKALVKAAFPSNTKPK